MWRGRRKQPGDDRRPPAGGAPWWVVDETGVPWYPGAEADHSPTGSPDPTGSPAGEGALDPDFDRISAPSRLALDVIALLQGLGSTVTAVASSLESYGVRATRDSVPGPVTTYLRAVVGIDPRVDWVAVDREVAVVGPTTVSLPPPVRLFIRAFEAGCFPALERGVAPTGRS